MNIGTWNTFIANELEARNIGITAEQEIRWTENGTVKISKSVIFYSGNLDMHQFGTDFVVTKKIAGLVVDVRQISESRYIRIKDEQTKDTFHDKPDDLTGSLPKHIMLIVLGNFNAKVDREEAFRTKTGKQVADWSNGNCKQSSD